MYLRVVHLNAKPDRLAELQRSYEERVIPVLRSVEGCLAANLVQSDRNPDECLSLTLWQNRTFADTYEQRGPFRQLLAEITPYLADSSEWRIHLSDDLTLKYEPMPVEPDVKTYTVETNHNSASKLAQPSRGLFIRIVSPQVREGEIGEFKRLYSEEVLPALRTVPGCRFAYLTENVSESNQFMSVTVWDSKQDAENYEASGLFGQLVDKFKHTFSEVYQWKMQLEKETHGQVVTSEEMTVEGYKVVAGGSFF
jgi:quinol monooxygenase YgiN